MALLSKKKAPTGEEKSLVAFIIRSREEGINDKEIIDDLKEKGFNSQQILDVMKKSDLRMASSAPTKGIEPAFDEDDTFSEPEEPISRGREEKVATPDIEELAEKIVEEKWVKAKKEIDEMKKWQDEAAEAFGEIKEKIGELSNNLELFKKALAEKLSSYSEDIKDVSSDIQAMDMVFKQILPELTSDVKELSRIVDKVKGTKK